MDKRTVPIKIHGKVVGSAEIDLDNLEGEIVGRIDDPDVAKEIFDNRLEDLSIYSGDILDNGVYGTDTSNGMTS